MNRSYRVGFIVLILAGAFLASSCHRQKTPVARRYPFKGRVVSIDSETQSAVIDGDAIPGFMDAMAMPYKCKPVATLNQLSPGDAISAEVVVVQPEPKNGEEGVPDYWLENVQVSTHAQAPPALAANAVHMPAPGEDVPDFAFINQDGRHISLKQYRGKVLVVTFIYTRCPFPDFCPRMSGNFSEIYKQLGSRPDLANLHLLTLSFDPEHDSPKVLRDYGFSVAHTHEPALFSRWEFAAPKPADLPKIANYFSLILKPDGAMITHNLSTAIIGPDGKIVRWYHGGDWQVSDLIKDAANARAAKP